VGIANRLIWYCPRESPLQPTVVVILAADFGTRTDMNSNILNHNHLIFAMPFLRPTMIDIKDIIISFAGGGLKPGLTLRLHFKKRANRDNPQV
jgi:hypothetical protein